MNEDSNHRISNNSQTAWLLYTSSISESSTTIPPLSTIQTLSNHKLSKPALLWALRYHIKTTYSSIIKPLIKLCDTTSQISQIFDCVHSAYKYYSAAYKRLEYIENSFNRKDTEKSICNQFQHKLHTNIYENEQISKEKVSYSIYRILKSRITKLFDENESKNDREHEQEELKTINELIHLGYIKLIEDSISWTIIEYMDNLINKLITNNINYKKRYIPIIKNWIHKLINILKFKNKKLWIKKLQFHIHEQILNIYLNNILSIIKLYPKSIPSLYDLKDCIHITDKKFYTSQIIKSQFQSSLLIINCKTHDILQTYVSTIRTLRFLDSSGFILFHSSNSIISYLRNRPDTIKCIVSGMTGDGDLYKELKRGNLTNKINKNAINNESYDDGALFENDEEEDEEGEDNVNYLTKSNKVGIEQVEDEENEDCQSIDGDYDIRHGINVNDYDQWEPEPIDAPITKYEKNNEYMKGDAITILVNIYGSNEQLVNEYKMLLGEKLVNQFNLNINREKRILNLLTERFGKQSMHECTIMLKDIIDSNEFSDCNSENKRDSNGIEPIIISKEFWPEKILSVTQQSSDSNDFVQFCELIDKHMDSIQTKFKETKSPRKLLWLYSLGCIQIKLDFNNRDSVTAVVSPMQLSVLSFIELNPIVTLSQIKSQLKVKDEIVLRRQITALVNMGILQTRVKINEEGKTVVYYEAIEDDDGYADNNKKISENNTNGGEIKGTTQDAINNSNSNTDNVLIIHGKKNGGIIEEEIDEDEVDENEENQDGNKNNGNSNSNQDEIDEMAVYETYVIAMVTNLKQLSLEQIHAMLKRFVQTPVYDKSQSQLSELLNRLVDKGKVQVAAGIYRIKK